MRGRTLQPPLPQLAPAESFQYLCCSQEGANSEGDERNGTTPSHQGNSRRAHGGSTHLKNALGCRETPLQSHILMHHMGRNQAPGTSEHMLHLYADYVITFAGAHALKESCMLWCSNYKNFWAQYLSDHAKTFIGVIARQHQTWWTAEQHSSGDLCSRAPEALGLQEEIHNLHQLLLHQRRCRSQRAGHRHCAHLLRVATDEMDLTGPYYSTWTSIPPPVRDGAQDLLKAGCLAHPSMVKDIHVCYSVPDLTVKDFTSGCRGAKSRTADSIIHKHSLGCNKSLGSEIDRNAPAIVQASHISCRRTAV